MRIAVCDDEQKTAETIRDMVLRVMDDSSCDTYTELNALLYDLEEGMEYQIIIMDIEWNGNELGIRIAEQIQQISPDTRIIYMTGYTEKYIQQIFLRSSNLSGFLVKPVTEFMMKKNLEKAISDQQKQMKDRFSFRQGRVLHTIPFYKILYLESSIHKIMITTKSGTFYCYGKLDEVSQNFPPNFLRCHKSYLINMDEILEFGHGYAAVMSNQKHIPVAKVKYNKVKQEYFSYMQSGIFENETEV